MPPSRRDASQRALRRASKLKQRLGIGVGSQRIAGGLKFELVRRGSGLLGGLLRRAIAPFRHELIEFCFVLGLAQAHQKVPELALLVF